MTGGEDDSNAVDDVEEEVDLRFSLDIYNVDRVCSMNEALGQVSGNNSSQKQNGPCQIDFDSKCF